VSCQLDPTFLDKLRKIVGKEMSVNTDQRIIKNKVGLLKLADMLGSVSEACKVNGLLAR
jgi:hypothetical protein